MRARHLTFVVVALAALALPAMAQTPGPAGNGFYDPARGVFQPVPAPVAAANSGAGTEAAVARSGTFVIKIKIELVSP